MANFETWYRSTLAAKLNPADVTCEVAVAPTVTEWRMHVYKGNTHSWIKYTGVTGTTLTWVTFVSQTADPATTVIGNTFPAGSKIELVAMHDQIIDKQTWSKVKVYANTAARDADIASPANGMTCYSTADGAFYDYVWWAWTTRASWATVNASTTVAWKLEVPTNLESAIWTETGWTWAILWLSPRNLADIYYFWDGSDWDVTISGGTSLTRDMYYNNLTVNTGITLDPAWYAIYVLGTLTLSWTAKIARNGNNASVNIGWAALATWTCWPCLWGSNGASGTAWVAWNNGTNWTAVATSYKTTWNSAAWGNGWAWGNAWGTWGTAATHTQWALYNKVYTLPIALQRIAMPTRALTAFTQYGWLASSGSWGSWGSTWTWTWGTWGGSWGNGGIIIIFANTLAWTWTIEALWGNGWVGSNGWWGNQWGGGGGGAGGCGGVVVLTYRTWTPWTITLTWGTWWTFWTWANGGSNGTAWANGTAGQSILITV